MISIIIL